MNNMFDFFYNDVILLNPNSALSCWVKQVELLTTNISY